LDPVVIRTALNAGDGRFTEGPVTDLGLLFFGVVSAAPAQLDGDAFPDLVVDVPLTPAEAWVLRGDGAGGFELPGARLTLLPPAISSSSLTIGPIADVDADGRLDATCLVFAPFQTWFTVSLNRTTRGRPAARPRAPAEERHQRLADPGRERQLRRRDALRLQALGRAGLRQRRARRGALGDRRPVQGGTMVPMPTLLSGPWPTTSAGLLTIAGNWPMGVPAGLPIAAQFWSSGPGGWSASSGVLITTP
jgi:hypothetical protein